MYHNNASFSYFPYIGSALTQGKVISVYAYTVPGLLEIGRVEKEDVVVFVPGTSANFSETFLFCNSYHTGDSVNVLVKVYNVTQQGGFSNFPENFTTIASFAVVNSSMDQWTTIVYDQIGREYSVANVTSPCQS